jgi:hypothetical protein
MENSIKDKIQDAIKNILKGHSTPKDYLLITEYQNDWVYQDEPERKMSFEENCILAVYQMENN